MTKEKTKAIEILTAKAFKNWRQATNDFVAYTTELEAKYGKDYINKATALEVKKYMLLSKAKAKAYLNLDAMYKKQDEIYEKH